MLLILSSDEADGDRRIIGSIRRPGFLRLETSAIDDDRPADGTAVGPPGRARVLPRKTSACFRTWEKSYNCYISKVSYLLTSGLTYSWLYASQDGISVSQCPFISIYLRQSRVQHSCACGCWCISSFPAVFTTRYSSREIASRACLSC